MASAVDREVNAQLQRVVLHLVRNAPCLEASHSIFAPLCATYVTKDCISQDKVLYWCHNILAVLRWGEPRMNVHHYHSAGGKDLILEYVNSLTKAETVDGLSVLEKLAKNEMDTLTIKLWRGKVHEVYFYKHNRMFFVIIDGADIYLLHACRKQKNRTERRDSDIVLRRAKELGDELSKRFI